VFDGALQSVLPAAQFLDEQVTGMTETNTCSKDDFVFIIY